MTRSALLTIALALALAAPADGAYTDERPATDPILNTMRDLAVTYWTGQGVHGCPGGITVSLATGALDDPLGIGRPCAIVIRDDVAANATTAVGKTGRWMRLYWLRENVRAACHVVFHETGHALGLAHTEHGLMSASILTPRPYACRRLARETVPWAKRSRRPA